MFLTQPDYVRRILLCDSAAAVMAAAAGARGGNGYGEQASPDVVTPYSYVILCKAPSPR
jgi:hypothetical protein